MLMDQTHKKIIITLIERETKFSDMEAICLQGWVHRVWARDDYEMNEQELAILHHAVIKRKRLFLPAQIKASYDWIEAHPHIDADGALIEEGAGE